MSDSETPSHLESTRLAPPVSGVLYVPHPPYRTEVPKYTVDLDQDPKLRWQKLVSDKKADVSIAKQSHL